MPGDAANRPVEPVEGVVTEALPNDRYRVDVRGGRSVVAHVSGEMRVNFVRILAGDRVIVEVSPFDRGRGRIVGRP